MNNCHWLITVTFNERHSSEYICEHLILFWTNIFFFFISSPSALCYQAAADFAKAHLPEALRQQLLTYEREKGRDREKDKEKDEKKDRGGPSYPSILEQQILTLDREMLDKLSATYNEAGMCGFTAQKNLPNGKKHTEPFSGTLHCHVDPCKNVCTCLHVHLFPAVDLTLVRY